jgi:hypothetical protein
MERHRGLPEEESGLASDSLAFFSHHGGAVTFTLRLIGGVGFSPPKRAEFASHRLSIPTPRLISALFVHEEGARQECRAGRLKPAARRVANKLRPRNGLILVPLCFETRFSDFAAPCLRDCGPKGMGTLWAQARLPASPGEAPANLIVSDPLLHANNLVLSPNNSGGRLSATIRNSE